MSSSGTYYLYRCA
jgi:hypothetical protein